MICFNKDSNFNDKDDLADKLQKLLDEIQSITEEEEGLIQDLKKLEEEIEEDNAILEANIASIIDAIYESLFIENNTEITLSVIKNSNNSLKLIIHNTKQ